MKNEYFCFNENGKVTLPNTLEIEELLEQEIEPTIFIDSCVCLHIVKLVDYRKEAVGIDKEKLFYLKEYLSKNPIDLNPIFGLMELSQNGDLFDKNKFWDFFHRINFFKQIPLKRLRTYRFDFNTDYLILKQPDINKEHSPFYGLDSFFLNTYACLLKIRELSLRGISKRFAEQNATDFLNWMSDTLGIILGVEYRLAMNIFGGETEFRKMIWLEGKAELIKKKLIGTAWDITHARFCSNNHFLNKTLERNLSAYFLTSDSNLYKLLAEYSLTRIFDAGEKMVTNLYNSSFNYPHLGSDFLDKNNKVMLELLSDRFNKKVHFDRDKVESIIHELEKKNNVA